MLFFSPSPITFSLHSSSSPSFSSSSSLSSSSSSFDTVLLDTNFLFLPLHYHINIEVALHEAIPTLKQILIPQCVKRELLRLEHNRKHRREVRFALAFLRRFPLSSYPDPGGNVDLCLLKEAEETHAILATNDKVLIKQALARSIPVARLYQNSMIRLISSKVF